MASGEVITFLAANTMSSVYLVETNLTEGEFRRRMGRIEHASITLRSIAPRARRGEVLSALRSSATPYLQRDNNGRSELRRALAQAADTIFSGGLLWRPIRNEVIVGFPEWLRAYEHRNRSLLPLVLNPRHLPSLCLGTALQQINVPLRLANFRLVFHRPQAPGSYWASSELHVVQRPGNRANGRMPVNYFTNAVLDLARRFAEAANEGNNAPGSDPSMVLDVDMADVTPELLLRYAYIQFDTQHSQSRQATSDEGGRASPITEEEYIRIKERVDELRDETYTLNHGQEVSLDQVLSYGVPQKFGGRIYNCLHHALRPLMHGKKTYFKLKESVSLDRAETALKNEGCDHVSILSVDDEGLVEVRGAAENPLQPGEKKYVLVLYNGHYSSWYMTAFDNDSGDELSDEDEESEITPEEAELFERLKYQKEPFWASVDYETRSMLTDVLCDNNLETNVSTMLVPTIMSMYIDPRDGKEPIMITFETDFHKIHTEGISKLIAEDEKAISTTDKGNIRKKTTKAFVNELAEINRVNWRHVIGNSVHICTYKFLQFWNKLPTTNVLIWAHNGARFDFPILLQSARKHFAHKSTLGAGWLDTLLRGTDLLKMEIRLRQKHHLVFRDSYTVFATPLAKFTADFAPHCPKTTSIIDPQTGEEMSSKDLCLGWAHLNPSQYVQMLKKRKLWAIYKDYCERDCKSLLESVFHARDNVFPSIWSKNPDITPDELAHFSRTFIKKITASAISYEWWQRYTNKRQPMLMTKLEQCTNVRDALALWRWVHLAVTGGASICDKPGKFGNVTVFDVNAQYPYHLMSGRFDYPLSFGELRYIGLVLRRHNGLQPCTTCLPGDSCVCRRMPRHATSIAESDYWRDENTGRIFLPEQLPHGFFCCTEGKFAEEQPEGWFNSLPAKDGSLSYNWNATELGYRQVLPRPDLIRLMKKELTFVIIHEGQVVDGPSSIRKSEVRDLAWQALKPFWNHSPIMRVMKQLLWSLDIKDKEENRLITQPEIQWRPEPCAVWSPDDYHPEVASGDQLFGGYYTSLLKRRAQAKQEGNKAVDGAVKLMANGFSGKTMKGEWNKALKRSPDGEWTVITTGTPQNGLSKVFLAAYMLAYVRDDLFGDIDETVTRKNVFATETDSMFVRTEEAWRMKAAGKVGEAPGLWKEEITNTEVAYFIAKKMYMLKCKDGTVKQACKGVSVKEMTLEKYEELWKGQLVDIKMDQLQRKVTGSMIGLFQLPNAKRTVGKNTIFRKRLLEQQAAERSEDDDEDEPDASYPFRGIAGPSGVKRRRLRDSGEEHFYQGEQSYTDDPQLGRVYY